jgi:iron complex outermembrane receptor protein
MHGALLVMMLALGTIVPATVLAQTTATAPRSFEIPAQPLREALLLFGQQSGLQVTAQGPLVEGRTSTAISGEFRAAEALIRLLAGTGLTFRFDGSDAVRIESAPQASQAAVTLAPVRVQGEAQGGVPVPPQAQIGNPPPEQAGGQVARGARVGMLGNRDVMDTPFSVTPYTSKVTEDQQAQSLGDVLVNDPSIRNTYGRGSVLEEFNVRGFTLFNADISFNGLYGLAPQLTNSLIGVERVEVLRGPNALLNGMAPGGSIGGGINLVPKRAGAEPITRVALSYVSSSQLGAQADVGRRFGANGQFGIRINGAYRDGGTPVDSGSERMGAVTAGLDYRGRRVRVEGDLTYQDRRTNANNSGLLFPGPVEVDAPDASDSFFPSWTFYDSRDAAGLVRAEVDLGARWTAFAGVGLKRFEFNSVQSDWGLLDDAGNLAGTPSRVDSYTDTATGEAGVRGRVDTGAIRHQVTLSGALLTSTSGQLFDFGPDIFSNIYAPAEIAAPIIPGLADPPKTNSATLPGIAVADTIALADDRIQLTLGVRHQQVEAEGFDAATGVRQSRYARSAVTPVIAAVIKPVDPLSLYGNYIEGLSQGPVAPAAAINAGEIFAPFISKQYEIGAKYDFGRLTTTVSAFQIDRPSSFTDPVTRRFGTDGHQRNRGLEVTTSGEIRRNLRALGGIAYTSAELTRTRGGLNDGNRAVAVPEFQANIGGEWDASFLPGLTITPRLVYTSSQFLDAENTLAIPGWTRLDLGARYAFDAGGTPITIRGSIENVLKNNYWLSGARGGLTVGAPLTGLLSVTADF